MVNEILLLQVANMNAVKPVKNPILYKHSKHIDVHYFFIHDKVKDGTLTVEHVEIENQVAESYQTTSKG